MNTAEIAAAAIPAALVLSSGIICATVRGATRSGYSITFAGPSLRFEPLRLPALAAAEAVTQLLAAGEAMTRRDAAGLLGIGERDVRALGKSGVLTEVRQGGRATLVTTESVRDFQTARSTP
jgi:hypothetical protein